MTSSKLPEKIADNVSDVATRRPTEITAIIVLATIIAGLFYILHEADKRQDSLEEQAQQQAHDRLMYLLENWEPKTGTDSP